MKSDIITLLLGVGLFIAILFLVAEDSRVVVDNFIGVSDSEHGLGIYSGHLSNGTKIIFEDTACIHGIGDTIEYPKRTLK